MFSQLRDASKIPDKSIFFKTDLTAEDSISFYEKCKNFKVSNLWKFDPYSNVVNPFTPMSDQNRISQHNITINSSRQVKRIKKNINERIIS